MSNPYEDYGDYIYTKYIINHTVYYSHDSKCTLYLYSQTFRYLNLADNITTGCSHFTLHGTRCITFMYIVQL